MAMGGGLFAQALPLRTFVDNAPRRFAASSQAPAKGYVPVLNFGPGGPKARRAGSVQARCSPNRCWQRSIPTRTANCPRTTLIAAAKKFFAACDKDKKGELDEKPSLMA